MPTKVLHLASLDSEGRNVCELGTTAVVTAVGCSSAVHTETTQTDKTVRSMTLKRGLP